MASSPGKGLESPNVGTQQAQGEPVRKVSILADPPTEGIYSYDNPSFESPRQRISTDHTEMGPVRKKSILHNRETAMEISNNAEVGPVRKKSILRNDGDSVSGSGHANGDARNKKHSVTDSVHSRTRFSDIVDDNKSWWYTFCVKCRSKEQHPSWHPPMWPKLCPYPFCPTYRQFSRIIALTLIGLLSWGVVYSVVGEMAAPGGQLFGLATLAIAAHFGGWLMSLTTLPALIGMLIVGVIFQNVGLVNLEGQFSEVTAQLRKVALVIILIRAGLDLDPHALKRLKLTVIKLGLGPWLVEAAVITISTHFFLDLPWKWGFMLGAIIAAVSPAVVVPCLFRLRGKGYGVAKGIPTLIIAVAGIDDATSVAIYGIIESIMFSQDSLTYQIIQGPLSIIGGIAFGVIWGLISKYVPEKHDPFMVPLRILMLLGGGMIAVFGSELIGFGGAGPLGCVAAAFVSLVSWTNQGWDIEDNPAATAFEIFWMIFEPILFGITGAQIKLNELEGSAVYIGIGCMVGGIIIRILSTILLGIGCKLNMKEKVFVAISWMSKATVQAALGPVALHKVGEHEPDKQYAEIVLMICVLSIILTAPTGAILITLSGPRLLTKTRVPQVIEGWRRSHRPSIRDISIIDEEEERDRKSVV